MATSLAGAVAALSTDAGIDQIFVIGGGAIYEEAVASPVHFYLYPGDMTDFRAVCAVVLCIGSHCYSSRW